MILLVTNCIGSESSQSSDESTLSRQDVSRKGLTSSVPESSLTTHQIRSDTALGEEDGNTLY